METNETIINGSVPNQVPEMNPVPQKKGKGAWKAVVAVVSVSYTHLDVYKRQVCSRSCSDRQQYARKQGISQSFGGSAEPTGIGAAV